MPQNSITSGAAFRSAAVSLLFFLIILTLIGYTIFHITRTAMMQELESQITAEVILFQDIYQLGALFPAVFASLATMIGLSSFLNSRWVEQIGSTTLVHRALITMISISSLLLMMSYWWPASPPLFVYLVYLLIMMFNFGLLFGNIMSLAMQPMGDVAGSASSLVGAVGTLIAIFIATLIGSQLADNSLTLVAGFLICCSIAFMLNYRNHRKIPVS